LSLDGRPRRSPAPGPFGSELSTLRSGTFWSGSAELLRSWTLLVWMLSQCGWQRRPSGGDVRHSDAARVGHDADVATGPGGSDGCAGWNTRRVSCGSCPWPAQQACGREPRGAGPQGALAGRRPCPRGVEARPRPGRTTHGPRHLFFFFSMAEAKPRRCQFFTCNAMSLFRFALCRAIWSGEISALCTTCWVLLVWGLRRFEEEC
jgi:hypothetical protein